MKAKSSTAKQHAVAVRRRLNKAYPQVACALEHSSPLQLIVATILSAQCTDARVNIVTRDLFKKYRTAQDYATADVDELARDVQSTGFFRSKAKNIQGCCRLLVERHGGQTPQTLEALVELPGVGRKTANVVLGVAFGKAVGVVVDTHVSRLSRRLGLTTERDPVKIERDLMALIPQKEWIDFSHRLIAHGRQVCVARKPRCESCPLLPVCPRVGVTSVAAPAAKRSAVRPAAAPSRPRRAGAAKAAPR